MSGKSDSVFTPTRMFTPTCTMYLTQEQKIPSNSGSQLSHWTSFEGPHHRQVVGIVEFLFSMQLMYTE